MRFGLGRVLHNGWIPAIHEGRYGSTGNRHPDVGWLIGVAHKVWRIVAVEPVDPGNWDDRARDEWIKWGMPDPWERAPFRVVVTDPDDEPDAWRKQDNHTTITIQPWHYACWLVVPEHYAVCRHCGEPAPCRDLEQTVQAAVELAAAEKAMQVLDGCCPACQEPITARQKVHVFEGENLLNPLGAPDVRFHTRRQCHWSAAAYEEKWVKADPTRPRSLLTLACTGRVIVHGDGTGECHGAGEDGCPSIYARHKRVSACYVQSHGCGQGCAQEGHPGTRLAKDLAPNGHRPVVGT